jgi:hypothetical protein
MKEELSPLELAVIEKLVEGEFPILIQLRKQLRECTLVKREFTGFGFYTYLAVPEKYNKTEGLDVTFGDVIAEIPNLPSGSGFLLYVRNGVLDMLEGYSYDEPWPSKIESFNLKYMTGTGRDWFALEQRLPRTMGLL